MNPKFSTEHKKKEARHPVGFLLFFLLSSCAVTATRPVQEMANTQAAIRAAREVQADTLAPELYRQANEWFFRARQEYKIKNFKIAEEYTIKARRFAEKAEFESIRNGGNRVDINPPEPVAAQPKPEPLPAPMGTPADTYEERSKEEQRQREAEAQKKHTQTPPGMGPPSGMPAPMPSQ